jgi:hypothetical protein
MLIKYGVGLLAISDALRQQPPEPQDVRQIA